MKKIWNKNCIIILLIVSSLAFPAFALEQKEDPETEYVISELEYLDLVRNVRDRWDENSTITRKDALTMAYLATNTWWDLYFPSRRFYNIFTSDGKNTTFSYDFDYAEEMEAASEQTGMNFCFIDVKPEDEKMTYSLIMDGLLVGKDIDGQACARLYDMMTNEEALITLIRMLEYRSCTRTGPIKPWQLQESESIYDKGLDLGLIKSDNVDVRKEGEYVKPVYFPKDSLNKPIKAFDYFKMYYCALGINIRLGSGYGADWTSNYLSIIREERKTYDPSIPLAEDILS